MARDAVLVTGMGIVGAAGAGVDRFRSALLHKRTGARDLPDIATSPHRRATGAVVPAGLELPAPSKDRAFALAERACAEALDQAMGSAARLAPAGCGLVMGTTLGGALKAQRWHAERLAGRSGKRADLLEAGLDSVADHLGRRFGLDGPRMVISNACVSGTSALGLALELIRGGETEVLVAGGVDTLHRFNFNGFANLGALSKTGECEPFGSRARGMILGEGAAFLVVELESHARERGAEPLAELAGFGAACDAFHITAPSREGDGAATAMASALRDAGATAEDVDLVLSHGVGTAFMDGMEVNAIAKVFEHRCRPLPVVSLRPVTGHTLGGVGAVDTIACVLALRHGVVPPTATCEGAATPMSPPAYLCRETEQRPVAVALNTSSGFGGVNAALVLRRLHDD